MDLIYVTRNNQKECTGFVVKYNDEYYSIDPKYLKYSSGITKLGKEYGIMRFADFVPYLSDPTNEEKEEAKKYEQNIIEYAETNPEPLYDFDYIDIKKEDDEMDGGNNIDLVTATATETEDKKKKKDKEKENIKKAMKLFGLKGEEDND